MVIMLRMVRVQRRRLILEEELLSIHSCGIVWQAVVTANFLALQDSNGKYFHYTEELAVRGREIARRLFSLHSWLDKQ